MYTYWDFEDTYHYRHTVYMAKYFISKNENLIKETFSFAQGGSRKQDLEKCYTYHFKLLLMNG